MKMKLSHKIIVGFTVLILLSGVFGPAVFYSQASKLADVTDNSAPGVKEYIAQAQSISITIGVLSVILGCLITFVMVKQIVTPILAINLALSEHAKNGKIMRISIPNRDEIGVLALYVNQIFGVK